MTPKDPRVSGWVPAFLPADEQLDRQAARLRSLTGHRVAQTWTVWALEHDEWFADLPVVLRLDHGPQLEVCWEKFDELSITWNTIDVTDTPTAWVEWPLEWRQAAHPALATIADATVDQIAATSSRFPTENAAEPFCIKASWLTTGLWLATSRGDLHIFNALDENGLSPQHPSRDAEHDWRHI